VEDGVDARRGPPKGVGVEQAAGDRLRGSSVSIGRRFHQAAHVHAAPREQPRYV
jgi:hypothetical protein